MDLFMCRGWTEVDLIYDFIIFIYDLEPRTNSSAMPDPTLLKVAGYGSLIVSLLHAVGHCPRTLPDNYR